MSDSHPLFTFASLNVLELHPDPAQPRKTRNEQSDKELGESMRLNGMLQTILVRMDAGKHIIVNGERRWDQASALGWEKVDCLITTADSTHALSLHLIENVQRDDLCPEDLAAHLKALMSQHQAEDSKATLRVLATLIGKSMGWVSEKLALANLPTAVQALKDNKSVKNSRVLIGLSKLSETNPDAAATLIKEIESGKSVSVDLINEVRGSQRKKRAIQKDVVAVGDLPAGMIKAPVTAPAAEDAPNGNIGSPAGAGEPRPAEPAQVKPAKRKKKVVDLAKLIGVADDLAPEDLLEAFAEAYAKLLAERDAVAV